MDAKRLLIGSVVGAILISVMGMLCYEVIFGGFFEGQMMVTAKESPTIWAAVVSALAHGLLVTLAIVWSSSASLADGFKTGAIVGLLVWLGADLILYALMEYSTLNGVLADAGLAIFQYGVAGAGIEAALRMGGAKTVDAPAAVQG